MLIKKNNLKKCEKKISVCDLWKVIATIEEGCKVCLFLYEESVLNGMHPEVTEY